MAAEESGSVAVLAEKPSVARDIARVLGAGGKGDGYLHGTLKKTPGQYGIHHVLDGRLARIHDTGQVEMLVGLHDQVEMPGRSGDTFRAKGQIGGQKLAQFVGKVHVIP